MKSNRTPTITRREKDYALFYFHNNVRSKKARDVDNGLTKGLTDNFSKAWAGGLQREDWPGIDTMLRQEPSGYTSKKGRNAFDEVVRVIGEPKL